MEQEIIDDIDVLTDYLKEIQEAVRKKEDLDRIDALDTLMFIIVGTDCVYKKVKEHYHLKEDGETD